MRTLGGGTFGSKSYADLLDVSVLSTNPDSLQSLKMLRFLQVVTVNPSCYLVLLL